MIIKGKYAASNFIRRQGIVLDTDKKCYNKFNRILSIQTFFEGCKNLPKLDYVLMFSTLYVKCEACTIEDFDENATIQLSLVYHKNRRLIIHESKNFQEIKNLATLLSESLKLKIRDSASDRRNPKWV